MQLCRNFFYAIDSILGTSYKAKYSAKARGVDDMLLAMGHIANLHAIGVLVIDEIQFLRNSKADKEGLLSFFVTLVNIIGIPVILVGTNSALPLLQDNFKEARRGNGLGAPMWDPLEKNSSWEHLVNRLWQYQWVTHYTPITDELSDALYEESQGIVDILIKLFMLVQMRIISVREAAPGEEIITPALIRKVAKEDFRMVRPMLDALKNKDMRALHRYDDLMPFQAHFNTLMQEALSQHSVTTYLPPKPVKLMNEQDNVEAQLKACLITAKYNDDLIEVIIENAMSKHPSGDFMLLMGEVISSLKSTNRKSNKPKLVKEPTDALSPLDLRHICATGTGETNYLKLLASGSLRFPVQEVGL